ncbi:MAG: prepilin-type N-terminal cleavage/methylation domain-containing protein [Clostridia bacterium]|nr:prepilin-type N-terminal cleavage/methylation domain-containing protein [Clostridia bacterium]
MRKNSRGFTLTELTISLTISILVIGIVTSMIQITKSNMVMTTESAGRINEFYRIEKFVNNWLALFSTDNYEIVMPTDTEWPPDPTDLEANNASQTIKFKLIPDDPSQPSLLSYSLTFDKTLGQLKCNQPSGEEQMELSTLSNMYFSRQGNLIKLTLVYEDVYTYTILFNYYF